VLFPVSLYFFLQSSEPNPAPSLDYSRLPVSPRTFFMSPLCVQLRSRSFPPAVFLEAALLLFAGLHLRELCSIGISLSRVPSLSLIRKHASSSFP